FIGISLGLIGGGGSFLTGPVLVYPCSLDAVLAMPYSRLMVGAMSDVGALFSFKKRSVRLKNAIVFGIPSLAALLLTREYILPAIPQHVLTIGSYTVNKNILLMLLFAVLMSVASYSMIKKDRQKNEEALQNQSLHYLQILLQGIFIGVI